MPTFADTCVLIPEADIPAAIEAVNASLVATKRPIAETIAMIAGAWPYAHQRADAVALDLHARQLAEDLAQFPGDILVDTVRDVRRELKFAPSIAELYQAASEKLWTRKSQLLVIEDHRREHRRRAAVRLSEADEERARIADLQARLDLLTGINGAMRSWTTEYVDAAGNGCLCASMYILRDWHDASRPAPSGQWTSYR